MGISAKKKHFFMFFLIFLKLVLQNELRFCLGCTKCIKMLLLSHTKSNISQVFQFLSPKASEEAAMLTWSTME